MTTKLRIARDLALPIDAATEKIDWLGRTGSGKTYGAMKFAELLYAAGVQIIALDYVGVWWGLRLDKDGKAPGLPLPVFGGLKGDVPIEPTAGKVIADLIVDKGISCVIDVSQIESDSDKARFASDFAARFFFRKKSLPSPVHLFIEEAQEYVPQNPMSRGDQMMLHAFNRMIKLGRNFGIGVSLISQRPQEVNKKALNQAEILFAFQMTGPQERKAVQTWIADKGIDEDIEGVLPKLARGAPHVWSPALLDISHVVKIAERHTYDSSSTPKMGVAKKPREIAPIDIEELTAQIKATVEKAKADDPKELRKQIAQLQHELRGRKNGKTHTIEKPVVDTAAIERAVRASTKKLRSALEAAMKFIINISAQNFDAAGIDKAELERAIASAVTKATEIVDRRLEARARLMEKLKKDAQQIVSNLKQALGDDEVHVDLSVTRSEPFTVSRSRFNNAPTRQAKADPGVEGVAATLVGADDNGDLPKGEKIVLSAIAQWTEGVRPKQLSVLSGYKMRSNQTYVSRLIQRGYVERDGSMIRATPAGVAALGGSYDALPQPGEELQAYWLSRLPDGERKVLSAAVVAYPSDIALAEIEQRTGYKLRSVQTYVSRLRQRQLVEGDRGTVRASDNLFS